MRDYDIKLPGQQRVLQLDLLDEAGEILISQFILLIGLYYAGFLFAWLDLRSFASQAIASEWKNLLKFIHSVLILI